MEARNLAPRSSADHVAEALDNLTDAPTAALQDDWRRAFGAPPPSGLNPSLLRLALAWRLQAEACGGLPEETRRRLIDLQFGLALNPDYRLTPIGELKPGSVLTREWDGRTHIVYVLEDSFAWEGRSFRSLTAVAKAITGKHWPGPAFFGLYKPRERAAEEAAS